jgi:hypothetical protein
LAKVLIRGSVEIETDIELNYLSENNKYKRNTEKAIQLLNSNKQEIAGKISNILEQQLPSSYLGDVKIETQLEFGFGSITWAGVIIALDWVGKIVDTITFVQIMTGAIQFAINKVITQETSHHSIPIVHETIFTTVIPDFLPASQTDLLSRNLLLRQDEQIRVLRDLSRNFDNLLRYIGQLQRKNSGFRMENQNFYFLPSRQANFILAILVFIAIMQFINYFGLDTIKGWFTIFTNIFH